MKKPSVTFDWQELEEGQEFPPLPPAERAPRLPHPRLERPLLIGGAVFLLAAALVISVWVARQTQAELAQIHDELALAVDAEIRNTGSEIALSNIPEIARASKRQPQGASMHQERAISVEVQALQQNMAAAIVVTETRLEESPTEVGPVAIYRQLRFYRQTTQGWLPAQPVPALWGQSQHLTTQHFEFTYRSRDAQIVQAVAADLDALYIQMRRNLGLPPTPAYKIAIEVIVKSISGSQATSLKRAEYITVSSPALVLAPDWLSNAEILRQSILLDLAGKVLEEAASTHPIPPHWYPILTPTRLWLIWDAGGPPTAWREPMLRWFYMDLQRLDHDAVPVLPAEYAELCALYSLWEGAPIQTEAFPLCHAIDPSALHAHTDWKRLRFMDFIRMPLSRFSVKSIHDAYDEQTYAEGRFEWIVRVALLEYAAATYGREQVSALWAVLHEHDDWTTLIPAVFGVSVEEFETGWQAYMADMFDE